MTRRKDGLWQQQMTILVNGRKVYKCFYGHTKQDVLKKIASFKEEQQNGKTFEKVAEEWWEQHEPTIAYNTTKQYKPALHRAINHFGSTYIQQIKPNGITMFLRCFIKDQHAADKTTRTQLMIINLICRYAVECGYLDANPARDLSVPKDLPKERREMPSDDDIQRVKDSTNCHFGLFAYWIMYTGCRRGELLALTWEDVNISERTISITKSLYHDSNKPKVKKPKTEKGYRTLPLMSRLLDVITPGSGIIFPNQNGEYMTETQFQKAWATYVAESGVSCTPHQLRHAYATMLFENGVSESDAQELLGHAQILTMKDIYTHIREQRKKKVRDQLLEIDIE